MVKSMTPIKSYVLRSGRTTEAQRRSYEELFPRFGIPYHEGLLLNRESLSGYFGNTGGVTMEIGFGMGRATAEIALQNPEKNYLGVEVHRGGVGKLLWEMEQHHIGNIRIIEHDAAELAEGSIAPETLEAIHIFFPDPWPKKRHHKRRLVKQPFTDTLSKLLQPQGYLYMVTDWEDYARFALEELSATEGLRNPYGGFAPRQEWRPETKFEQKGLEKAHGVYELYFVKGEERYV